MPRVILVTGGARSGKSRYALVRAAAYPRKAFVATAEALDDEMRRRIDAHQRERGTDYLTVEEPLDLAGALAGLPREIDVAVVDCLTLWLSNLMHHHADSDGDYPETAAFLAALGRPPCDVLVVTNELGMGLVPTGALARAYRDQVGSVNQRVASLADEVVLLVSGIPLTLKEPA